MLLLLMQVLISKGLLLLLLLLLLLRSSADGCQVAPRITTGCTVRFCGRLWQTSLKSGSVPRVVVAWAVLVKANSGSNESTKLFECIPPAGLRVATGCTVGLCRRMGRTHLKRSIGIGRHCAGAAADCWRRQFGVSH